MPVTVTLVDHPLVADSLARIRDRHTPNSLFRNNLERIGTLLLAGSENYWAPLRDGLWSAVRGRGFTPGAARYPLPPLPGFGPPAIVRGTGAFEASKGGFREVFAPLPQAPAEFTGERQLHLALE